MSIFLSSAAPGGAAVSFASFNVSVTVNATCVITANPLSFSAYTGGLIQATATISITCTTTTPYTIGVTAGLSTGATVSTRKMTAGAKTINYALFKDNGYSQNWGVTAGTDTQAGTGTGSAVVATVYGQIAAGQYVTPGAYSDTVSADVTY